MVLTQKEVRAVVDCDTGMTQASQQMVFILGDKDDPVFVSAGCKRCRQTVVERKRRVVQVLSKVVPNPHGG